MDFQQFVEKYEKLELEFPLKPSRSINSEDVEYGNYLYSSKNAYFSFDDAQSQNIVYIYDSFKAQNCCDGDYVIESEGCYECFDVVKANNCTYLNNCSRIFNAHFCWDCDDSNNLFGCSHLKHKEYCVFNKQYSKTEYEKIVTDLLRKPAEENLKAAEQIAMQFPVTITRVMSSENCDYGNHITNSKNLYLCFDTNACENGGYLYDTHFTKYSYDMTQSAHNEYSYECVDCARLNNCYYMSFCSDVYDSGFCENCTKSNHLFGCTNLDNKEYCILNKQYTKEGYEKEVQIILESYRAQSMQQVLKKLESLS